LRRVGVASAAQSVLLRHLSQVRGLALDARSPPLPEADHPRCTLKGCLLPDSTPGFLGLRNLKKLKMHYTVMLKPHLNSAQFDALAALITGCPRLHRSKITVDPNVLGVTLKIAAPHLRDLFIKTRSIHLMVEFQSLPRAQLRLPFFRYVQEGGSKLLHILQSISQVEKLELLDRKSLGKKIMIVCLMFVICPDKEVCYH
jgi:hypothetical protein